MSKSNLLESKFQRLIFLNEDFANIGDATGIRGSTAAGSLYFSLHTASPGEGGNQTTNEVAYTGYARVAVARGSGQFSEDGAGNVANVNAVTFGQMTGSLGGNITHFGIGTSLSGSGQLIRYGALTPTITQALGLVPEIPAGQFTSSED